MFSLREINKLKKLINPDMIGDKILSIEELKTITSKNLIRDSIFVSKIPRIVILKKLFTEHFDLSYFVQQITFSVVGAFEIRIGLSFIAQSADQNMIYFFAIRARPINHKYRIISNKKQATELVSYLRSFSNNDLLNHTFLLNDELNSFSKSGFRPRRLVLAVFWITKDATDSTSE